MRKKPIRVGAPYLASDRKYYYVQWNDPLTGRPVTRSTKCVKKKDAQRFAAELEIELNERRSRVIATTWGELCQKYKDDVFPAQREKTRKKTLTTMGRVQKELNPRNVLELTTDDILRFKSALRKQARDISDFTVKGHLSELRKILKWAARNNYLDEMPNFEMPDLSDVTIHAPDENAFAAMLKKVVDVVGKDAAPSWEYLLTGLWWSGLRLSEALVVRWDRTGLAKMWVELEHDPPMFRIASSFDKKGRDRTFPIVPEFCEFLEGTPTADRRGFVFNPAPWGGSILEKRAGYDRVGKTLAMIGEAAKVETSELNRQRSKKIRFATAHDLRRSFGVRWASRVLPPVLMELMRHDVIQSVMKYYVGRNAAVAGRQAWDEYRKLKKPPENPPESAAG